MFITSEIDRIKQALQKTGFPLELEVSTILTKRGYDVWGNQSFELEGKIREIDMDAVMPIPAFKSFGKWELNPNVAIESKMSRKYVWIFHRSDTSVGHCAISHGLDAIAVRHRNFGHLCSIFDLHYASRDVASTFAIVDPKTSDVCKKDEIFDAANKLREFVNYRSRLLLPHFDARRRDIIFYFPIIVFDGMLYEGDSRTGTLRITPIDSIVLETRTVSSITGKLEPMYIDVVTKNGFVKHLSMIEREAAKTAKNLSTKRTQNLLTKMLAHQ